MLNFRQSLPAKRNLVALACGFLVTSAIWWWWTSGNKAAPASDNAFAPAGELDRIEYAVRNARSWRVTTVGTMHGQPFQAEQDVVCPSDSHTVTRITSGKESSVAEESIESKGMFYAREGIAPWSSEARPGKDQCMAGPMAGPAPLVATLDSLKNSTTLRRGSLLQLEGGSCRVLDFIARGTSGPMASLCVDDATHLPYELSMGALRVHYTHWNMPIVIEPPPETGRIAAPTEP